MALRHFAACWNLAPASWSAAVPSAALDPGPRQIPKSARKDRRTPRASPFRGIIGCRAGVMALRHFAACWNLAPASWSAAVPSAAFPWNLDFGIYLEVGRWNVEFFLHDPPP